MAQALIDTVHTVETPEGVTLELRVAGLPPRALAWLVDLLVRGAVYSVLAVPFSMLGTAGRGLLLIGAFLLEWAYPVLFEVLGGGATPGKRALGLVVVHDDGSPVRLSASLVRNLLRAGDFLPVGFVIGAGCMLVHPQGKRLGDLAAGTLVLHSSPRTAHGHLPAGPAQAPPLPLSPAEQQAIVEFGGRAPLWTAARQIELSELLRPLTGEGGAVGLARLLGIARWVRGGSA